MSQRALHVVHYWGGCPQVRTSKWQRFHRLISRCAAEGLANTLVLSRIPEAHLVDPFRDVGCSVIAQPRPRWSIDLPAIRRTTRLLKSLEADVLHCHNVHTSPLLGAALAGTPVRIWSKLAMSPYYEQGIQPRGWRRLMPSVRLSCGLCSRVLALSRAIRDELVSVGVPEARIEVLPAPIDLSRYALRRGGKLRAALGLGPADLLAVSVGHAVPVKGWDVLVSAFARVAAASPRLHLALVGSIDGPQERDFAAKLRASCRGSGLEKRVHFTGQHSDIPAVLADADVFAFPSRSDGQGLALTEALAAGLPCVAAASGGIPELIADGQNGLLVPREDARALAGALRLLVEDATLRERLAAAAKESARRFDMDVYADRLIGMYRELYARPARARRSHRPALARTRAAAGGHRT